MTHMALMDRTGRALAGTVLCPQHDTEPNRIAVVEGVNLHRAYWTWADVTGVVACDLCGAEDHGALVPPS